MFKLDVWDIQIFIFLFDFNAKNTKYWADVEQILGNQILGKNKHYVWPRAKNLSFRSRFETPQ